MQLAAGVSHTAPFPCRNHTVKREDTTVRSRMERVSPMKQQHARKRVGVRARVPVRGMEFSPSGQYHLIKVKQAAPLCQSAPLRLWQFCLRARFRMIRECGGRASPINAPPRVRGSCSGNGERDCDCNIETRDIPTTSACAAHSSYPPEHGRFPIPENKRNAHQTVLPLSPTPRAISPTRF